MLQRNLRKLWTWYLFFYYLLHMKMKKMLLGAFLGMFALAGVAVLPNVASADTGNNFKTEKWFTYQSKFFI